MGWGPLALDTLRIPSPGSISRAEWLAVSLSTWLLVGSACHVRTDCIKVPNLACVDPPHNDQRTLALCFFGTLLRGHEWLRVVDASLW